MSTAQWERQAGESSEAFRAFALFRDLGQERSLAEVSLQLREQKKPSGLTLDGPGVARSKPQKSGAVGRWSRQHNWVERARAWDGFLDRQRLKRVASQVEKMAERHANQAMVAGQALMAPILAFAQLLQDPQRAEELKKMSAADLLAMALASSRFLPKVQEAERAARGVRIERNKDEVQGGHEWVIRVHQPERGESPEMKQIQAPQDAEWEEAK